MFLISSFRAKDLLEMKRLQKLEEEKEVSDYQVLTTFSFIKCRELW